MNSRESNFAYKIRHALNENLDKLPPSTTERLASARKMALARKKRESPLRALLSRAALAGGGIFSEMPAWVSGMGLAIPLIVVATGLVGLYDYEQERRIRDTAEIDAEVLIDDLPPAAYADHGFNAFLAKRAE